MPCNTPTPQTLRYPDVLAGDLWTGLSWIVSDVTAGHTEFSGELTRVRFEIQDLGGVPVLALDSDVAAHDIRLDVTAPDAWSVQIGSRVLPLEPGTYRWALSTIDDSQPAGPITRLAGSLVILPRRA